MALHRLETSWRCAIPAVLLFLLAIAAPAARAGAGGAGEATVLCATPTSSGYRLVLVDGDGGLRALTVSRAVPTGRRVELETSDRALAGARARVRTLGRTTGPIVVRSRLIEGGYAHYGFYRNGRSWGCAVEFDDGSAASVAKLIVSAQVGTVRLGLRAGRLVHLGPKEAPLAHPRGVESARRDVERFVSIIGRGDSLAACAEAASDALLVHGGRDGCVMDFEGAKFLYRDRFSRASVGRIDFFEHAKRTYAVAMIRRRNSRTRALFVLERGRYRFASDLQLTRIELW